MGADLPLIARRAELATLTGAIEAAKCGRGEAMLLTGEAGVGKTRLLSETQREAERRGVLVLKGRAVESGGAYRPLVEAFARVSAPFVHESELAGVRPILARVLPGWVSDQDVLAPMADPAAVLAEALILLLRVMAAGGAVLLMDDVHWADEDTVSVLSYLADSIEQLPLALIMTARTDPLPPDRVERLSAVPSIRQLPLSRLTPSEVRQALRAQKLPALGPETVDQLVTAVDGLPLVLDEFVRQLRESPPDGFDMKHTTLAAAVQKRLRSLPADGRVALDAMSVVGEADSELLGAITGLDEARLSIAIHDAVSSTLLVPASTPLGVTWRHPLMRDAVRDLLLPLERQSLASSAADQLANAPDPSDGQLRQAAEMYELAGYPDQAARKLIQAAHAAVRDAALDVAEQHLAAAQALTGAMPEAALEVLVERIETLTLAGRAGDGYHSGIAVLQTLAAGNARPLLVATARAAYAGGLGAEGAELLARLQEVAEPADPDLVVLRAHSALVDRQTAEAIQLGQLAAARALDEGRFELACEALLIAGTAAQRRDIDLAARILHQALALSEAHQSSIWQVQILAAIGTQSCHGFRPHPVLSGSRTCDRSRHARHGCPYGHVDRPDDFLPRRVYGRIPHLPGRRHAGPAAAAD